MRIRTHANPFHYYKREERLDLATIFPAFSGTLDVECGFGTGGFMQHYMMGHPDRFMMGFEIRQQAVALLQERIPEELKSRVYLHNGTAEIGIEDMLPDQSIDRVFVFHPDPWFKKSHHKRRLIKPAFLKMLTKKMKPGARLYVSTDVEDLWMYMRQSLDASPFHEIEDPDFWRDYYLTPWQQFSVRDSRNSYRGVFELS